MLCILFICWRGFKAYRERLIKIHTVEQHKIYFKQVGKNESKEKKIRLTGIWGLCSEDNKPIARNVMCV